MRLRFPLRLRAAAMTAALAAVLLLTGCYTVREGTTYLSMLSRAKSVSSLAEDPTLSPARKAFLERVARIRAFAIEELGLTDTKNYTTLIEVDGDRVATVVQACAELKFDRYLWDYPVVGRLPYIGFFHPQDAEKERARLKALGWDVIVRGVDAFSTLGWFRDPLYSFMENYGEAELAELLIHEMTHATAFSKSAGSFNEELATFVGRMGAEAWIIKKAGADSSALAAARSKKADAEAFASFLAGTAAELKAVYESAESDSGKRAEKARVIAERAAKYKMDAAPAMTGAGYRDFPMEKINNAFLDLYALYEGEPRLYAEYLREVCAGDLRRFIAEAAAAAKTKDPKATMKEKLSAR